MLKKMMQLFLLILSSAVFFFCKSNDTHEKKKPNQLIFIESKITKEVDNPDKSKVSIFNYVTHKSPIRPYTFKVADSKIKKVLKKRVFVGEKIECLDATTPKCTKHVGMIQKKEDCIPSQETKKKIAINYSIININ
ncbi:MAG: hypothetical protein ACI9YE_001968 [Psychroserpens sp.]|jgi:hypothetical protein